MGALLFGTMLAPARSEAATGSEAFVLRIAEQVIALANSGAGKVAMRKRFEALVNRYSDVRSVALLALGPYRKQLPPGRSDEFFRLVTQYIAAFFVYYIDEFQGTGLEIKGSAPQGKSTIIDTRVTKAGPVKWRIAAAGGGYRVLDINVRAIWLSLQLKKRFTDVLKASGGDFDALFKELRSARDW
jgi:phospholipid transport system substrate-binding protein